MMLSEAADTLSRSLTEAGFDTVPDFAVAWRVLREFCQTPAQAPDGEPVTDYFSWEFYRAAHNTPHWGAGFLRVMETQNGDSIEECFCTFYFAQDDVAFTAFAEPEVIDGFNGAMLSAFFAATESSFGFRHALTKPVAGWDIEQAHL